MNKPRIESDAGLVSFAKKQVTKTWLADNVWNGLCSLHAH